MVRSRGFLSAQLWELHRTLEDVRAKRAKVSDHTQAVLLDNVELHCHVQVEALERELIELDAPVHGEPSAAPTRSSSMAHASGQPLDADAPSSSKDSGSESEGDWDESGAIKPEVSLLPPPAASSRARSKVQQLCALGSTAKNFTFGDHDGLSASHRRASMVRLEHVQSIIGRTKQAALSFAALQAVRAWVKRAKTRVREKKADRHLARLLKCRASRQFVRRARNTVKALQFLHTKMKQLYFKTLVLVTTRCVQQRARAETKLLAWGSRYRLRRCFIMWMRICRYCTAVRKGQLKQRQMLRQLRGGAARFEARRMLLCDVAQQAAPSLPCALWSPVYVCAAVVNSMSAHFFEVTLLRLNKQLTKRTVFLEWRSNVRARKCEDAATRRASEHYTASLLHSAMQTWRLHRARLTWQRRTDFWVRFVFFSWKHLAWEATRSRQMKRLANRRADRRLAQLAAKRLKQRGAMALQRELEAQHRVVIHYLAIPSPSGLWWCLHKFRGATMQSVVASAFCRWRKAAIMARKEPLQEEAEPISDSPAPLMGFTNKPNVSMALSSISSPCSSQVVPTISFDESRAFTQKMIADHAAWAKRDELLLRPLCCRLAALEFRDACPFFSMSSEPVSKLESLFSPTKRKLKRHPVRTAHRRTLVDRSRTPQKVVVFEPKQASLIVAAPTAQPQATPGNEMLQSKEKKSVAEHVGSALLTTTTHADALTAMAGPPPPPPVVSQSPLLTFQSPVRLYDLPPPLRATESMPQAATKSAPKETESKRDKLASDQGGSAPRTHGSRPPAPIAIPHSSTKAPAKANSAQAKLQDRAKKTLPEADKAVQDCAEKAIQRTMRKKQSLSVAVAAATETGVKCTESSSVSAELHVETEADAELSSAAVEGWKAREQQSCADSCNMSSVLRSSPNSSEYSVLPLAPALKAEAKDDSKDASVPKGSNAPAVARRPRSALARCCHNVSDPSDFTRRNQTHTLWQALPLGASSLRTVRTFDPQSKGSAWLSAVPAVPTGSVQPPSACATFPLRAKRRRVPLL